jgi:hypothetical protein
LDRRHVGERRPLSFSEICLVATRGPTPNEIFFKHWIASAFGIGVGGGFIGSILI